MTNRSFRLLTCAIVVALVASFSATSRASAVTHAASDQPSIASIAGPAGSQAALVSPVTTSSVPNSVTAATLVSGTSCTPSCDLYAMTGTLSLPGGASAPIYGYSASSTPGTATLPGPTLVVNQGDAASITLHNVNLPSATSLMVPSAAMAADTTGVASGGIRTYALPALAPGTYLYQAGLTADGARQVAMGLFGALIVRPNWTTSVTITSSTTTRTDANATVTSGSTKVADSAVLFTDVGSAVSGAGIPVGATIIAANEGVDFTLSAPAQTAAYGLSTPYDDEAVVVLSEIDPAFNAAPSSFDLGSAAPRYWLINGKAYPATAPVATGAGRTVLLRYINAGLMHHSMSLLGLRQTIIGVDANLAANRSTVVAQTIATGGAMDTLTTIPSSAPAGAKYALFEAAMHLDNNGVRVSSSPEATIAFGGMLTFLQLSGTTVTSGPTTTNVTVTPNPTNGTVPVTLSATLTASSGTTLTAAEYFVDVTGANGAGCALSPAPSGSTASASWTIATTVATAPCVALNGLSAANHAFYVHAQDSNGAWGSFASAVLTLDKQGPSISGIVLTPNRTNGTVDVAIQATASDAASGNQDVIAAEYSIDGGAATAFAMGTPASTVSLTGTITAATVFTLAEGPHAISIRAQDAFLNWGAFIASTLTVDKTGPATTAVIATPNPTNGTWGVQGGSGGAFYERLQATVSDPLTGGANSPIVVAEYFIDTTGANGTGYAMLSTDGAYNSPTESVYQLLPLFGIAALSQGQHTIYVHGNDAAGNWGSFGTVSLTIDKTGPSVTGASVTPNPSAGANTVTLAATATDPANTGAPATAPASNVVAAEWFMGADPGLGLGTPINVPTPAPSVSLSASINVSGFSFGSYTIYVRARDAARNWGPITSVTFVVSALFANGFDSGNFTAWNGGIGGNPARLTVVTSPTQSGSGAMRAAITSGTSGYVQDNTPAAETRYHARFYFNPSNASTNNGTARTIFVGLNTAAATVFTVEMRRVAGGGGTYEVRGTVSRAGGTTNTNWFAIAANAFTAVEVAWSSGTSASFSLYTGGVLRQTLTGLNTSAFTLETVRLGPQGDLSGMSGTQAMYFDSFVSTRSTLTIGP